MQTKKIRINKGTYDRLMKKGRFGDSIDDIVNRILDSIGSIETSDIKEIQTVNTIMNYDSDSDF